MTIKQILTALETAEKQMVRAREALKRDDLAEKVKVAGAGNPAACALSNIREVRDKLFGIIKASELK